jgi:hypothetical protein
MARPILKRTLKTYERDIAALRRLRTAIALDASLETRRSKAAVSEIDRCVKVLIELTNSLSICA